MAQKKGQTELADQFEGGVSTEKAMLDIKRGVMENLSHECKGFGTTATPKKLSMLDPLTGNGIAAIDRVKHLFGKDYKNIAKGEGVIVPHIGNVDTIQIPINQMGYLSQELPRTDLVRMQN